MHFFIRVKVTKPRELSNNEFFGVWQRESIAGRDGVPRLWRIPPALKMRLVQRPPG